MKAKRCASCGAIYYIERLVGGKCPTCRERYQRTPVKESDSRAELSRLELRLKEKADSIEQLEARLRRDERSLRSQSRGLDKEREVLRRNQEELQAKEKKLVWLEVTVNNKERSFQDRDKKLALAQQDLARKKERMTALERQLRKQARDLDSREKKLAKQQADLKRRLDEYKKRPASQKALEKEHAKQARALKRARNQVGRLKDELSDWQEFERVLDWLGNGLGDGEIWPNRESVVAIGSEPYSSREMRRFLKGLQFDVNRPGDASARIMVVGRDDWSETDIEHQLELRQGEELRIYSQEMFLIATALARDPFDECAPDDLIAMFGIGHPALEYLINSASGWPAIEIDVLSDAPRTDWGVDESPLHVMGYRVGMSSDLSAPERHAKLRQAFESTSLPYVHSDEYMREWGRPRSARRLWRIAHHVAYLARRRDPRKRVAGGHWTSDLAWMKKTLFKPWMKFRWPGVSVPGSR